MDVTVTLLGPPAVVRDGEPAPAPKGRKVWALLAALLLAERPPARSRLAGLLFADADDPLGALRWNLAEARRLLGDPSVFAGDPVDPAVDAVVDVHVLLRGRWTDALDLPGLGHELLEGMQFGAAPGFDAWLQVQRSHLRALGGSMLHEAGLSLIAAGRHADATAVAARLVDLEPYDENAHTLLVRSLASAGDRAAAQRQVRACTELFRTELGLEPTPALRLAADVVPGGTTVAPVGGRAAARAQLEAGDAAIAAGAVEAGLQCLRRAVGEAAATGDGALHARTLVSLGSALVHAVRGRDLEGAAALHESIAVAARAGVDAVAATACRELGFVDVQQGRHERAEGWLERAETLAGADRAEQARIAGIRGMALSDAARYPEAVAVLRGSAALAEEAGAARQAAWSLSILGRAQLLVGDLDDAAATLAASVDLVQAEGWAAFLPWPEAFAAEVDLQRGRVDAAADAFDHAFALGCQIGDPCWEGIAGRGVGLVELARSAPERGFDRLQDAWARCSAWPDSYQWVMGYVLDAQCAAAVRHDHPAAPAWTSQLERLAARTGMRDLLVRAYVHRAGLGDTRAGQAAMALAEDVESPALHRLVGLA